MWPTKKNFITELKLMSLFFNFYNKKKQKNKKWTSGKKKKKLSVSSVVANLASFT